MQNEGITSSLSLETARRVDALCREFECAWRGGARPRLEDFLDRVPAGERAALFDELLRLEVELRLADSSAREDLCRRFPDEAELIAALSRQMAEELLPSGAGDLPVPATSDGQPTLVGRYRLDHLLGEGAFGRVYRATDAELHRTVAVKLSRRPQLGRPTAYDVFLAEARILARLDHPAIAPVYDVGRIAGGQIYIVTKLIEGATLAERLLAERPGALQAAQWLATIAEALHSAHAQGLVHRDVKPSNLLLDVAGSIFVSDFGLALCQEDYGTGPALVGTPAYMSPEQARGEGHRVDARSDVFSLGVVLYELLTGLRPFRADTRREMLDQILIAEPRPPRQLDRKVPRELERLCLRAMSKRAADRFATAREMADDLRRFVHAQAEGRAPLLGRPRTDGDGERSPQPPSLQGIAGHAATNGSASVRVAPKGLRSFGAEDADFFIGLLPGPRDREGLPLSIQFWRRRIERRDAETFRVGLLYGPSGCGKSSLVKAGIVPRLADHVVVLTLEASTDDTETRLSQALTRRFPALASSTLADAFAALRRGGILPTGKKLLVVIDQFEQWLHGGDEDRQRELTRALRQCDGAQLQCLLLIRDDFWLAANRFLRELEIPIVEDENSALVDLFDARHARKVLAAFGQAYGALAANPLAWTREQEAFLDRAVAGLAQDNKIVCVRLALFAEMIKDKPWSPAYLDKAGGPEGIGEAFLESVFAARSAPPGQRLHAPAARGVLGALLPEEGVEIKGHVRTAGELRDACGYAEQPREFESLMTLLDTRLHLISPVDCAGDAPGGGTAPRRYQLTHDYLVPSLRTWLTRKQRETCRGRAELCLAERAAWWKARPGKRHLPTTWEWLAIRLWTRRRNWNETEERMMRGAGRFYRRRTATVFLLAGLIGFGVLGGLAWQRAGDLVGRLATAQTEEAPAIIGQLAAYRPLAKSRLAAIVADASAGDRQRLHASLALLASDPTQLDFLRQQLLNADPARFLVLRKSLAPYRADLLDALWTFAEDIAAAESQRWNAACALAAFLPADDAERRLRPLAPLIAGQLVSQAANAPRQFARLLEAVRPARSLVVPRLMEIYNDSAGPRRESLVATSLLLELAGDRPRMLAGMLLNADAERFAMVLPAAKKCAAALVPLLTREIEALDSPKPFRSDAEENAKDLRARRQANAALAVFRLGFEQTVWPLLRQTADPRRRSFLIYQMAAYGVTADEFAARLEAETDASCRRALLLALGEIPVRSLSEERQRSLAGRVQTLYQLDADPGVHAAAQWLLKHWGRQDPPAVASPAGQSVPPGEPPSWYVNGQGQTMIVVPGPAEFLMELFESRDQERSSRRVRIERSFAIGGTEVTMAQYSRYSGDPEPSGDNLVQSAVSWYDAARYCNWLSQAEGIPHDQWCYVVSPAPQAGETIEAAEDCCVRTGYRLPTEIEWDYACRAGTVTPRFYGNAPELLAKYAWYYANSDERRHPAGLLRPNDWGLFDVYGNVWEWCNDAIGDAAPAAAKGATARDRRARGAPYTGRPWFLYSSWRSSSDGSAHDESIGFRVARTMRMAERAADEPGDGDGGGGQRVERSGVYTFNAWFHQTGVRRVCPAAEPSAGRGFRVARTQPR